MANEKCPKCNGPMAESRSVRGQFFCITPEKDCRIKELGLQLRAREADVLVLREAVEFIWKKASSCRGIHDPKVPCGTCYAALDEIRKFCAAGILGEEEKP